MAADGRRSGRVSMPVIGRCECRCSLQETFANLFAAPTTRHRSGRHPHSPQRQPSRCRGRAAARAMCRPGGDAARFHRLGAHGRLLAPPRVPTHGEPNLANVLIHTTGHSTSLTGASRRLARRESDLTFFTGERFAAFLETYSRACRPRAARPRALSLDLYRWVCRRSLKHVTPPARAER